tara:strand:+ start:550 stop:825 length:276 start_codon:yes stop_codon:yes gene_type:complete
MNHYLTKPEIDDLLSLSEKAKEIESLISDLTVASILSKNIDDETKSNILDWIKRAETFKGLSYFLTPQSEWTGGDSTDESNFKYRKPHICK